MDRRTYLKSAGAALGSCVLASTGVAATDYERTVNIVEAGADPTGSRPIDDVFRDVARDGTLVEFPEGEYLANHLSLYGLENFGMRATGDATLVPGSNYDDDTWIGGADTRNLLVEGFTLDTTADDASPTVTISNHDGLVVRDVVKRGPQTDGSTAFSFRVVEAGGEGLIENLRAPDGGTSGDSVGVYVNTTGTLTLRDCRIEEFGNNGLYASGSEGPVQVESGFFRNNNVASVRLGSAGSYVKGTDFEVSDPARDDGNYRAIRISDGPGPVTIEDADIDLKSGQGTGGVVCAFDGGSFHLRNSRIRVSSDYTIVGTDQTTGHAVYVDNASGVDDPGERTIRNLSVTGGGSGYPTIDLNRDNNTIEGAQIQQSGSWRSGVHVAPGSTNNSVVDCAIEVTGEQITNEGEVHVENLTDNASPDEISVDVDNSGGDDEVVSKVMSRDTDNSGGDDEVVSEVVSRGTDNSGTDDEVVSKVMSRDTDNSGGDEVVSEEVSGGTDELDRTLSIEGGAKSNRVGYEFVVSGSVRGVDGSTEGLDSISGKSASGYVWGWDDTYQFDGELVGLSIGEPAEVTLDGESVSPNDLPSL